jgi:DNA-directed RNA polymerase specialized sigma24 family protein
MKEGSSFTEFIERVRSGDQQAASQLVKELEPVVRRELRFRLRDSRARLELDSMDISQSVLSNFFVRVATRQYDLEEQGDLVRLLVAMTRNKVAEKLRSQHRQRRDSRRTVPGVEGMALASTDPTPSRVLAAKGSTSASASKPQRRRTSTRRVALPRPKLGRNRRVSRR